MQVGTSKMNDYEDRDYMYQVYMAYIFSLTQKGIFSSPQTPMYSVFIGCKTILLYINQKVYF